MLKLFLWMTDGTLLFLPLKDFNNNYYKIYLSSIIIMVTIANYHKITRFYSSQQQDLNVLYSMKTLGTNFW